MSTLVYVHGTNGSGKSTLARAVINAAGGIIPDSAWQLDWNRRAKWAHTTQRVVMVGKYTNRPCGGVDCIAPYRDVYEVLKITHKRNAFAEGLMTPGIETCRKYADLYKRAVFIHLDTPVDQCLANHLKRKETIGSTRPYDPKNLYKKAETAKRWRENLERAGLEAYSLQWPQAKQLTFELFGLNDYDDLL